MPVTVSQMAKNEALLQVKWGDDPVNIKFSPGQIVEAVVQRLQGPWEGNAHALANIIKSWDVLNDDGTMFPLDPEHIQMLPMPFRADVTNAIIGSIHPNSRASQEN